jgi:hypothetical protein
LWIGTARRPDLHEATWTSSNEAIIHARELGHKVRDFRNEAGLQVADLSSRTKIGHRQLQALEEGRFEDLPGPVFIKGFIRSICDETGKDPVPLIQMVDQIFVDESPEESESTNGSRRTAPLILSGILLVGLITGGILLHGSGRGVESDQVPDRISLSDQETAGAAQGDYTAEEPIPELDLLLAATEKTWLRIQADSSEPWETTMRAGDEIRLRAMERVTLFIGNAGGLLFELNGRTFGPLGRHGQVISNYVITRDNL